MSSDSDQKILETHLIKIDLFTKNVNVFLTGRKLVPIANCESYLPVKFVKKKTHFQFFAKSIITKTFPFDIGCLTKKKRYQKIES